MNPFDGNEVTIRTSRRKRSHSKVFDYVMKCLRDKIHIHMLRYKAGTNKTQFEVDFYDMKVHNQWNPKRISLFMAVDKIVKEGRKKERNYCQNTKNRFKSNMRKLENKYIKFLYEDKKSTALRTKSYMILNPPAVHQVRQQNIVPEAVFQSVERLQVPGESTIVAPPGREIDYQGSQSVDVQSEPGTEINANFEIPDEGRIENSNYLDVEIDQNVEEENSSLSWIPGSDCSRSDWTVLEKQNRKGSIMVSSVSETTLVSVDMTDSSKGINFPDFKLMDEIMNYEIKNGNDTLNFNNSNMINGYGEDKENFFEAFDCPCLLGNYEDKVPLNSYQNDLTLDCDENVLYGDPFNGEKPNIEVSSNEIDLDFYFDGEVDIETISDIDLSNEFLKM